MTMLPIIRSIVTDVLPGLFNVPATLHVWAAGDRTGPPTYTDHVLADACFVDRKQIALRGAGLVEAEESAIVFYQNKLPAGVALKTDDEITVTDKDGNTKRHKLVRLADEDPAEATQTWAVVDSAVDS